MLGRRLLVLVAVLMGLTALAASLAPPPQTGRGPLATATPSPAPAPTARPRAGATVSVHLSASPDTVPHDVAATRGDVVDLVVTGDVIDTVTIGGLAVMEPIDPDSPARVELFADRPGSFPIRLLDAGRRIGTLRISA
jgi:hypothetical protein